MFAVPGWSVQPSALKTQKSENESSKAELSKAQQQPNLKTDVGESNGKKRKRESGKSRLQDVNTSNLAELWDTVIEGVEKPKKQKSKNGTARQPQSDSTEGTTSVVNESEDAERPKKKTLKEKKHEKKMKVEGVSNGGVVKDDPTPKHTTIPKPKFKPQPHTQAAKPASSLTPLQASMRQKLISARFRHLNQTLYTTPSEHSLSLFSSNPEMFTEYHEGFRRQVEVWPENPVDSYIAQIKERARAKGGNKYKGKDNDMDAGNLATAVAPLPRTEGTCRIADLGCGDAGISHGLEKEKKKHKLQIHSFDLQSPDPLVTKADVANLPMGDDSVDVAIFCLALMGTNWVDFIEEAFRILRWKGELWVAEIKSRFGRVVKGSKKVVEHSVGNRKKLNRKDVKKGEEEGNEKDLLVEVDGHDVPQETDVSAFVEVLRKRGFVLQNEVAVDLNNKMFVKMSFVKGLTPIKGKCVPIPKGMEKMGMETWRKKPKGKFIESEDVPISSEASVLKPCVYKIR